ncbi:MAG: DUF4340 domain-containing protein [Paludisphaera borealis]|uniref:DUF4340 domain-containing protein n=1 Tax=Paludisphaera borealis TaxID=1387353 RepID=UPI0028483652|nr:DUF4340 domain-containing protein [Paludisphaera borealis]MDR3618177.1 DUF4340 domain-containing protein [Paludisphaera borealis]
MKTSRTTYVLIGLFFAGLLLLWGLEFTGVLTESQRRRRQDRILPALTDVVESGIQKVEIDRKGERLIFERRGRYGWQMRGAIDAAADANDLESLLQNLRALRRSADAGVIDAPAESYGLAPAEATLRLWTGGAQDGTSPKDPVAVLEIGKTAQNHRYVKTDDAGGIDVVDRRVLAAIDRPAAEWRDKMLAPLPTFQVTGLSIQRPGVTLKAERMSGGQWRLTEPVRLPADGSKIEAALAALAGLRIAGPSGSFAADDVKDFAPYGLDKPEATIELTSSADPSNPTVLMVGKSPADQPGRVYVRRGDQDDVALIDAKFLAEIPADRLGFRSQHIAEITPPAAYRVEIKAPGGPFELVRNPAGWNLTSPKPEKADRFLVESLLGQIDALQTSEYLDPAQMIDVGLDPPIMSIRVWEIELGGAKNRKAPADAPPAFELALGRHDILKKTIYARLPGDSYVLALPDTFMQVLPKNSYAFRDRTLPPAQPAGVAKLTFVLDGRTTVLEPDRASATPNQWRMIAPVKAPADVRAVTAVLAALSNLRADDFAADSAGDGVAFGLNAPLLDLSWEGEGPAGGLKVGKQVPGKPSTYYAVLSGYPPVFTLDAQALQPYFAEMHETLVQKFPLDDVRRLVLQWPDRTLVFARSSQPTGQPTDWSPEPGTSAQGIDLSRFNDLAIHLSQLHAVRFAQYEGPIPTDSGLAEPRLKIEIGFGAGKPPSVVRLGSPTRDGFVLATTGDGATGPVFLLPGPAWEALIEPGTEGSSAPLPADVFAPPDAR